MSDTPRVDSTISQQVPDAAVRSEMNGIWSMAVGGAVLGVIAFGCNPFYLFTLWALACAGTAAFRLQKIAPESRETLSMAERTLFWATNSLAILLSILAPTLEATLRNHGAQ